MTSTQRPGIPDRDPEYQIGIEILGDLFLSIGDTTAENFNIDLMLDTLRYFANKFKSAAEAENFTQDVRVRCAIAAQALNKFLLYEGRNPTERYPELKKELGIIFRDENVPTNPTDLFRMMEAELIPQVPGLLNGNTAFAAHQIRPALNFYRDAIQTFRERDDLSSGESRALSSAKEAIFALINRINPIDTNSDFDSNILKQSWKAFRVIFQDILIDACYADVSEDFRIWGNLNIAGSARLAKYEAGTGTKEQFVATIRDLHANFLREGATEAAQEVEAFLERIENIQTPAEIRIEWNIFYEKMVQIFRPNTEQGLDNLGN
ncbi:MAG: hypothetical protein UT55_C0043G0007 [Candidatus Peregrinibacteria bacterium GW2011_GWE2_39_6]|nr:MAG: hypothetical protein UT36_C0008G0005 [Candidatus Peregrinibacteria bacterium GW2011_GWF2_39_17]KKR25483.1 MAG: hypothetical protein UT55_C0043G0007 [Candidatus Peregrinibacteria bacterium GW2011_GWE2_39_6]HCW32474.1 hypothetical protein [Candidatus Peregrinibacteria bacterium]